MKTYTWFEALHDCQTRGERYVIVTVLSAAGSTPRESGCKMIVTPDSQFDTIGGGHLEYIAVERARTLLLDDIQQHNVESFPLAAKLGQCCGGAVKVLFEVRVNHVQHVAVFGAGHVAQALVPLLAQLPLQIRWIDNREVVLDSTHLGTNVTCLFEDDPLAEMESIPDNTWVIILTHNHQLDYELVERALKNGNVDFLGMIGSTTKAKRFTQRLRSRGFKSEQINQLISPIGDLSIPGKRPIEVAVSIGAQLIRRLNGKHPMPALPSSKITEPQST